MPLFGRYATHYPSVVALVLLLLTPFLILTTSVAPLEPVIAEDLGLSLRAIGVATAMANAAYAFGSVLSVQLVTRLPPRRMLVLFITLFVIASALAAWSPTSWVFFVGHIAQGMLTGLLLIAAVPPLVLAFPRRSCRRRRSC